MVKLVPGVSLALALGGFSMCSSTEFVTCDDDVLACDDNEPSFELDPSCSADEQAGSIEIVAGAGDGEGGFRALSPDEVPDIHFGAQGGMHMWTGFQIRNPNLERSLHRITFVVEYCPSDKPCTVADSWATGEEEVSTRVLVLDDATLRETGEGWLELRDVLLFLAPGHDGSEGAGQRMTVTVEDVCGRVGEVVHEQLS